MTIRVRTLRAAPLVRPRLTLTDAALAVLIVALAVVAAVTLGQRIGRWPTPIGVGVPLGYAWLLLGGALLAGRLHAQHRRLSRLIAQQQRDHAALRRHTAGSAHDMRAPMVTVSSYLELLAAGDFGPLPAAAQRAAAQAARAAARARLLVEATLAASTCDRGPTTDPVTLVDLNAVVGDVVAALGADIARTHAELAVATLPAIRGSEPAYFRIFENLVQNALRYTKANSPPRIEIAVSEGAHGVEITVRDEGCGIRADDRERVFVDRVRGPQSGATGLGLGLATVRELVDDVGGSVWIDPAVIDGTCVRVWLPFAAGSPTAP
ncbi:MAG: HAMP domain-containing sensor histidine kinase [Chloroflexi bacterium]|nr:HAMP domain-containing sensor histidine kinase [Chloroflexota bacterium]